jgi:hypothetical protein
VLDVQPEVLGDLVFADDLADRTTILSRPERRPPATIALTYSSSRAVAAMRSFRFSARSLTRAGMRHAIRRSPG